MANDVPRLMAECQGLVRALAWKIHRKLPRHVELDELIGYGNLGLAQAAHDFDPHRGWKFTTYAYHRIRGAILDGLQQMRWFQIADYHRGRYEHLAQDALETTQPESEPPPGSVDQELDWLREACGRVAMVRLLSGRRSEAESLEDPSAGAPPKVLMQEEARQMLWRLVDQLPPPADDLIRATYCDGLTLKEAAERLGKNKAWASRLHAKALRHLARQLQALESA